MTAITDTRKRSRDEDSCDFLPISKRINNLSINNQYVGDNSIAALLHQSDAHDIQGFGVAHSHHNHHGPLAVAHHQMQHNHQYTQMHNGHHLAMSANNGEPHMHGLSLPTTTNGPTNSDSNYFHINNNYMGGSRQPSSTHSIRNVLLNGSVDDHHQHQQHQQHQHHQHQGHQQPQQSQSVGIGAASQSNDEIMSLESYNPELTQDENPFYYNKNKLLFDLHIERQRRHPNT